MIIKTYVTSYIVFEKYGVENCVINLLESVNANTSDELKAREAYYIKSLKCVNKIIPLRKPKEYRIDNQEVIQEKQKIYRKNNKDAILEKSKIYYENNKEHVKEYKKEYTKKIKKSF